MKALRRSRAKSNASETSIKITGSESNLASISTPDLGGSGNSLATGSTSLGGSKSLGGSQGNMLGGPEVNVKRDKERGERGTSDQPWKSIVRKTAVVNTAAKRYFTNSSSLKDTPLDIYRLLRIEEMQVW